MDMPTATESVSREQVLEAMAEVMERQARVARAEAAVVAARRRLGDSVSRLAQLSRARGESLDLAPLAAIAAPPDEGGEGDHRAFASPGGTLRERIVAVMEASPYDVYTPARLASAVASRNRDSIRNTLLVLAAKGRIEKLGEGRYRARRPTEPEAEATG